MSNPWCRVRWALRSRHQCGSHLADPGACLRRNRLAVAEARGFDVKGRQAVERRDRLGSVLVELPSIRVRTLAMVSPVNSTPWRGRWIAMLPSVWPGIDKISAPPPKSSTSPSCSSRSTTTGGATAGRRPDPPRGRGRRTGCSRTRRRGSRPAGLPRREDLCRNRPESRRLPRGLRRWRPPRAG